jgi:hypothetical protein
MFIKESRKLFFCVSPVGSVATEIIRTWRSVQQCFSDPDPSAMEVEIVDLTKRPNRTLFWHF